MYNVSLTGGTVNGGAGTGAAVHVSATAGGTLTIGSGATINAGASGIAINQTGGAAAITTAGTLTGNVNLGTAANTLSITGGAIAGNISGGGNTALKFDLGAGSFTYGAAYAISGVNSVAMNSGSVRIDGSLTSTTLAVNGGSLTLNGAATVSSGVTTISGGTLQLGNGGTTGSITGNVTNNGTLVFNRSNAYTFAGLISGSGAVNQAGTGTTILTGANTYSGQTWIQSGTLALSGNGAIASSSRVVADGAFDISAVTPASANIQSLAGAGTVALGAKTLTLTSANDTFAGSITGTGGLTVSGGTQTLTGTGTFGSARVSGTGELRLDSGGKLTTTGSTDINGSNVGATVSGAGSRLESSTLFVRGNVNGYASTLNIVNGGVVKATNGTTLGSASSGTATLNVDGAASRLETGSIAVGVGNGAPQIFVNVTNGGTIMSGTVTVGTSFLAGPAKAVTISGGGSNWTMSGDLALRYGTFSVLNGGTASSTNATIGSQGPGALLVAGAGSTYSVSGNQLIGTGTYTGTVTLANGGRMGVGGALTLASDATSTGILNIGGAEGQAATGAGFLDAATLVFGPGTGRVNFNHTDAAYLFSTAMSGGGSVNQTGPGTTILTADNSYTGLTTIAAGTLQAGNGGATGTLGTGNVVDNGTLAFNRSDDISYGGAISGTGALLKLGGNTLTLTGNSSYGGLTTISAGTLQLGNGGASGSISGDLTNNGTLAFDRSDTYTSAGLISGSGVVNQIGCGTTILTANNGYTGGTTIAAGTLQLGNGGTSGSIAGDVTNNGTISFDRSDAYSFAGAISGTGSVNNLGSGITTLTGNNSYTGTTNVTAGTLLVNGNQSAATGLTTVASGATLGGTGIIGGDVTVADGGTLSPGASGNAPGTLTINGALALNNASNVTVDFGQANLAGGPLNDLTTVGGNLVLDGTLNVSVPSGGTFGPGLYRVFNYSGTLTDNGLTVGTIPSSDYFLQTAVAHQVNLVNTAGLALNYWDGGTDAKFDGVIDGGDGVWQSSLNNDNWANSTGVVNAPYATAAFAVFAGKAGTVTVDNSLGQVTASGMQFVTDGYVIQGGAIQLIGSAATIRVGDGTTAGAAVTATIASELGGTSQLVKTDAGRLVLSENNSYSGGTAIDGGTLQLGNGGTTGSIVGNVVNNGTLAFDRADNYIFNGVISGSGTIRQIGTGLTRLTADSSTFSGTTSIAAGALSVNGSLCGDVNVLAGGRLQGIGTVCDTNNYAGGTVAPGNSIGTLTVAGDYLGDGGTLEIETRLGGDASPTDRLVVTGNTSGTSTVKVINVGGTGAQTVEGIKIVDVGGASNGSFSLAGDYLFQGEQAVIGGAYAYRLYKGGVSTPADGDWYLRSTYRNPADPEPRPLYAPGTPLYEAYAGVLQSFNELGTLQQRIGNRSWGNGEAMPQGTDLLDQTPAGGKAIWARIEAAHAKFEPETSTTGADYDTTTWKFEAGLDGLFYDGEAGALIGGLDVHYGTVSSNVTSIFGSGSIDATGYGVGGSLTWYGNSGFYADAQAQATWYDTDLTSATLGRRLADGNNGFGYALSIETGQKIALQDNWSLTPQIQLSYSSVKFNDFTDPYGARVSLSDGDRLTGRLGLSADYETGWKNAAGQINRAHVYGVANLYYDFLDGSDVDVSGTSLVSKNQPLWGGLGLGGSLNLGDRSTVYGEAFARTSLADFGDSNSVGAKVGFRVQW